MAQQRLKGQEVSIIFTNAGTPEFELSDIRNFEDAPQLETSSQGYLGEKTNRTDDVYNGMKFSGEMHIHSTDLARFQAAIISRAKRETPDVIFNIVKVSSFPNGQTQTRTLLDVKFGEQPTTTPGRGEFVTVKFDGVCDDFTDELS